MPKVSVVIPMYNAAVYIEDTIKSVLQQTFEDWELIIVDDCSTDNSVEIAKRAIMNNPRCRIISTLANTGGPAGPRNLGVEHSSSDYIAFLDSDDVWSETKLMSQISFMNSNSLDFSSTDVQPFCIFNGFANNQKFSLIHRLIAKAFRQSSNHHWLFLSNPIYTSTVILKTNLARKFSFDTDHALVAVEDLMCWLSIFAASANYGFLDLKLCRYRILEKSISSRASFLQGEFRHIYACTKYIISTPSIKRTEKIKAMIAILLRTAYCIIKK